VSSIEPNGSSSEINGSQKVAGGLVVAGGNGPELLELTKEVLDQMARLVQVFVVVAQCFSIRLGGNHGRFPGLRQRLEYPRIRVIALVGDDDRSSQGRQQDIGSFQIAGLAGRQQKAGRVAERIDGGMNLGAQSASAATNGLAFTLFFFAPALCW
jgi:hypothetical protein